MNQRPLEGRVGVVTGAARGLGRSYALRLAKLGADVAVLDFDLRSFESYASERDAMTAESTAAEIAALGRRAIEVQVDVTDSDQVTRAIDRVAAELGSVDIVVCNAGGGEGSIPESLASSMPLDTFDRVVRRNLYGTVYTCQAAVRHMSSRGWGRIVTVSSQGGRMARQDGGYAHYGAAKAGVEMYTRYLAQEVGRVGITVNCVAPGLISTGRLDAAYEALGMDAVLAMTALGRLGTPEECADAVEFLVGPLGNYVTGATIAVDGGVVR